MNSKAVDPFNYPMPNRKDLMSLNTINQQNDGTKTTTKKFVSQRIESNNLHTGDIEGKKIATVEATIRQLNSINITI